MALEGTIKDFGLPDIFQLIGLQRKTGTLTLQSGKEEVTVTFENGMVVMADSSSKRLEDRLGHVLVKQGKLSAARLEEALQTQKATLQRLGHVLVTSNAITAKDLREALQVQVSQIVFKVFRWRDGEYLFAPTDSVDYDRDNFAPMSADFILMEGIRMVDEWPIIEKKIPSMDLVFRPVVDHALIEVVEADAADGPTFGSLSEAKRPSASSKIRLTRQEENIFRKVDGTRTVQGIIDSTGLPEFETCRTLFDLLNRNLISTVGRGAAKTTELGIEVTPEAGHAGMGRGRGRLRAGAGGHAGPVAHAVRGDGPRPAPAQLPAAAARRREPHAPAAPRPRGAGPPADPRRPAPHARGGRQERAGGRGVPRGCLVASLPLRTDPGRLPAVGRRRHRPAGPHAVDRAGGRARTAVGILPVRELADARPRHP